MKPSYLLLLMLFIVVSADAETVTSFQGIYRNGQVFFTWNNLSDSNASYKLYRSSFPITQTSDLTSCDDLGEVSFNSSLNVRRTEIEGSNIYISLDSGVTFLSSTQGVFVITCESSSSFYYALTTIVNGIEDDSIIAGGNSLLNPVDENVAMPQPLYQGAYDVSDITCEVYLHFGTQTGTSQYPPMVNIACVPFNFAIYRNGNTANRPLIVFLHGGGGTLYSGIDKVLENENRLSLDDWMPNGSTTRWFGYNQTLNMRSHTNPIPVSDTNVTYTQRRITWTIDWAINFLKVDSHRVYLDGTSMGAGGSLCYSINFPHKIAAVKANVPLVNAAFDQDFNPNNEYNAGNSGRLSMDSLFGTIASDLPCSYHNLPHFLDRNFGAMFQKFPDNDYPVYYLMNGKNDSTVGWTEKPLFYDSVNKAHIGGYYFWDLRGHSGGGLWKNNFDLLRYKNNESFPAFSNCSINGNPGDGHATDGDTLGSINGFLDWAAPLVDSPLLWKIPVCMRELKIIGATLMPPDSCFADVTPRRLQQFNVPPGSKIFWKCVHKGILIQSDSFLYAGGLIVIPGFKIFSDTSILELKFIAGTFAVTVSKVNSSCAAPGSAVVHYGGGTSPYSILWSTGNTESAISNLLPGNYSVTVTDSIGRTSTINFSIMGNPSIAANVTPAGPISYCKNVPVTLQASTGYNYHWQWNKNSNPVSDETNETYTPKKSASYSVTITNGSCTKTSNTVQVTVYTLPSVQVSPSGPITICSGGNQLLSSNTSGSISQYQWRKNSATIANATNPNYTATQAGKYSVVVTNTDGCTKISNKVQIKIECKEVNDEIVSAVFPNPSNSIFVFPSALFNAKSELRIYDELGKLVEQYVCTGNNIIVGSNLSPGFYVAKIISVDDEVKIVKLVKQ